MTTSARSGRGNARSDDWQRLRTLEDVIALLLDVSHPLEEANKARIVIKREAWEAGNTAIYQASQEQKAAIERQRKALERLKAALSERWHYLMSDLDGAGD